MDYSRSASSQLGSSSPHKAWLGTVTTPANGVGLSTHTLQEISSNLFDNPNAIQPGDLTTIDPASAFALIALAHQRGFHPVLGKIGRHAQFLHSEFWPSSSAVKTAQELFPNFDLESPSFCLCNVDETGGFMDIQSDHSELLIILYAAGTQQVAVVYWCEPI